MRWRRLAVAAAAAALTVLVTPAPARAAHVCTQAQQKFEVSPGTPVEDQIYDPKRLSALATGRGIKVAVIDSGVDADHPQLNGQVDKGRDFLFDDATGRQDCVGHGTGVASVIAARPAGGTGFQGLAPDATIVPIRISEQEVIDGKADGRNSSPEQFAQAIDFAVDTAGVQVINLSLTMAADNAAVAAAVQHAVESGVVVVAAAGNDFEKGNPDPYPALYPGVIGVASVNIDGVRAPYSQTGKFVDIAAIGENVTTAAVGSGHRAQAGTSFATPFVAATAALLKQRFPDASPDDVLRRLTATADPAPGGTVNSPQYGHGLLNPYRALTETLGPDTRAPVKPVLMQGDDPAVVAMTQRRARSHDNALLFASIGAGAAVLLALTAAIVARGRRRGWQPAPPDAG